MGDGGGVQLDDWTTQQVFDADIAKLTGTEFSLDPPLGRRDIHHAESGIEGGVDDLGLARRIEGLDGHNEPLGVHVAEDAGRIIGRVDRGSVDALALFGRVIVEEGDHLEGVRTRAFDGLFGDDARLARAENHNGRRARGLEPLIDGADGDPESDEQDGRTEQFNGDDAQGNRVGAAHAVGGEILGEEQTGACGQGEQHAAGVPGSTEPDDARIGPEDQHGHCPDDEVRREEVPGGDQFVCGGIEFEADGIGQSQAHRPEAQVEAEDGPARDQLGTRAQCVQQVDHPRRQDTDGAPGALLSGLRWWCDSFFPSWRSLRAAFLWAPSGLRTSPLTSFPSRSG